MLRALFVSVNILSVNCRGVSDYVSSPGDITAYGAPILYLTVQSLMAFAFLVWWESGNNFKSLLSGGYRHTDAEEKVSPEPEVLEELERVKTSNTDGLRVLHLTKAFGPTVAVDDTTFGVKRGEVFGLLGPNGAGKSTTISVIRGDLKPSTNESDIFIENISLRKKKAVARQHLSACPQHDAMDRLTVTEHLQFYARIRGVRDVTRNVEAIVHAVGLTKFKSRMAEALSGGNKRKLSLGIALMGNPAVMLLDEPSSGMDVAAKRVMWRTLEAVVPGRSIVLTTHSMEEADRLCSRAGILAKRMLAIGTTNFLRKKHGNRYYVHLLLKSAPYTTPDEGARAVAWIEDGKHIPGARLEGGVFHGQIRFSVPAGSAGSEEQQSLAALEGDKGEWADAPQSQDDAIESATQFSRNVSTSRMPTRGGVGSLFATLEECKNELGFEYYSVSQTSLDQVFLSIVGKHNVQEEGMGRNQARKARWWKTGIAG
jgi:ATP-binding cassette, subfamily A (ABC1), member 3